MSETTRWRTPPTIRRFIAAELARSKTADDPWLHLQRAHIASQPWAWPHTKVHGAMLGVAIRQYDPREVLGQLLRLVVGGPGSLLGRYPPGNTGRTTMALTEIAPVPDDLRGLLEGA